MDWSQVLTIIGANLVMMFGMLGITVTLFLHANKRIDAALEGISKEMKDFHGRLCAIEERRIK
jgi:hypothetical protein